MNIDFALILVIAVFVTGTIWLLDKLIVNRGKKPDDIKNDPKTGIGSVWTMVTDFSRFLFPVVFIVLLLRGFIAEPFRIPSGSMLPTLDIGDFILVNKFSYGIRLPAWNKKIIDIGTPKRGDVIVFRYPDDPSIDYIKRVVGVPGDKVAYYNKVLYINGKRMPQGKGTVYRPGYDYIVRKSENLSGDVHDILDNKMYPARDFVITVPKHRYFVMGDNRDNSRDSRYWGFVPDKNLVGHAMIVWFNWELGDWPRWTRIGTVIN